MQTIPIKLGTYFITSGLGALYLLKDLVDTKSGNISVIVIMKQTYTG
jgi:hypothetical protein